MSETLRTFIAASISPPPPLTEVLEQLAKMKWPVAVVTQAKLHITLKFLGDTPAERLPAIRDVITTAISGRTSFALQLRSLGAFPRPDRPSVVWAGLESSESLTFFASRLDSLLEPLGFPRESRPFSPHLTLARIKSRPPLALFDLLRHHAATYFGAIEVRCLEFIRSELHPDGARYSTLSSHELS